MTETVDNETRAFIEAVQLLEDAGWVVLRPDSKLFRQSDTRIEGGGEAAYGERKLYLKDGPALRLVRLRFFRDMIQSERIKVYEVFGIDKDDLPAHLTLGIEQQVFNQLFVRTAVPPVNKSPTPEHVEGDVLSVVEMESLTGKLDHEANTRDLSPEDYDIEITALIRAASAALTSATTRIQQLERDLRSARLDTLAAYGQNDEMSAQLAKAERERDSWRRVAERLEGEKLAAEAQLADAVKVLKPFASRVALPKDLESAMRAARAFISTIGENPDAE